jgi:hypothetical protein
MKAAASEPRSNCRARYLVILVRLHDMAINLLSNRFPKRAFLRALLCSLMKCRAFPARRNPAILWVNQRIAANRDGSQLEIFV